jgi:hypothetical protein
MTGHYFISYSRIDAEDDALWLADKLVEGPPRFPVWVDTRELRPGEDWDEQVGEAVKACRGLLFVMTTDSVRPNSICKGEWTRALKYKKPVIPLRFDRKAELPFRLQPREYIDFTGSVGAALTRLRKHLEWMDTPAGALQALKERLADAERELERAPSVSARARIEQELGELRRRIDRGSMKKSRPTSGWRLVRVKNDGPIKRVWVARSKVHEIVHKSGKMGRSSLTVDGEAIRTVTTEGLVGLRWTFHLVDAGESVSATLFVIVLPSGERTIKYKLEMDGNLVHEE